MFTNEGLLNVKFNLWPWGEKKKQINRLNSWLTWQTAPGAFAHIPWPSSEDQVFSVVMETEVEIWLDQVQEPYEIQILILTEPEWCREHFWTNNDLINEDNWYF